LDPADTAIANAMAGEAQQLLAAKDLLTAARIAFGLTFVIIAPNSSGVSARFICLMLPAFLQGGFKVSLDAA